MVLVILFVVLVVLEVVLVVLDLSWRSWTFTEASEVWVWVDWRPLKHFSWANYKDFAKLKLQTARSPTLSKLQTRDLVQNHRLDVLYHPGGVLDLEKEQKPSKNPKNCFLKILKF